MNQTNVVPLLRYAGRTDAQHVLDQLPPLGGPENVAKEFLAAAEGWRPTGADGAPHGGFVLMGPTGTGKSTLLTLFAKRLLATLRDATSMMFIEATALANDPTLAPQAKRVRYLLLDDVGRENDGRNVLFDVLNYRHSRAPTFITTPLTLQQIDEHFDSAFKRRLCEFKGRPIQQVSLFTGGVRPAPGTRLGDVL